MSAPAAPATPAAQDTSARPVDAAFARYRSAEGLDRLRRTPVIDGLLAHRSVRAYLPHALPDGTIETLVAAAQSGASSSNLQVWSVVAVEDAARKARLAALAGDQRHTHFTIGYGVFMLFSMLWAGGVAALIHKLVLPRMRGTAAVAFGLLLIVVGSATGPYWIGKISTLSGSLTTGLASVLALVPLALLLLYAAAQRVGRETPATRLVHARAAGEPV